MEQWALPPAIASLLRRPSGRRAEVHIHLVGIGGAGLSAIAKVLLERGYTVSGSDLAPGPITAPLSALGATIYAGHAAAQVAGADFVLVSSAVPADNPEVVEARRRSIPVLRRPQFLGWLTAEHTTIAVAGTHGKTTTTAMIAWLLSRAGQDPSYIIGGVLPELGSNAHAGSGLYFVIEADEYDRTFLGLRPYVAVITTVEWDHVDCYPTPGDCRAAFEEFAARLPDDGLLVVCADDMIARELGELRGAQGKPVVLYGLDERGDWQATEVRANARGGNDFAVWQGGRRLGTASLRIPGRHNVANALAALAVADHLGIPFDVAAEALAVFAGAERRFEHKGESHGIIVIDDYAHHPTEIRATLAAARQRYPGREIWAVFQPHTYSRTGALLEEFAASFADADHVIVTDIYAARERDTLGISAVQVVERMVHPDARHIGGLRETADFLLRRLQPGDVLITLGAGDGYRIGQWVLAGLEERGDAPDAARVAA
ncbi:MAG: UDP-N-acetylmuramate--L-alanine ligase [Anaerolineae bacterium]|nr:UDP-N-acetylmuramate--L-alanine ligase [Anaerolineae bacterium]